MDTAPDILRKDRVINAIKQAEYEISLALVAFKQIDNSVIKAETAKEINTGIDRINKYKIENIPVIEENN